MLTAFWMENYMIDIDRALSAKHMECNKICVKSWNARKLDLPALVNITVDYKKHVMKFFKWKTLYKKVSLDSRIYIVHTYNRISLFQWYHVYSFSNNLDKKYFDF